MNAFKTIFNLTYINKERALNITLKINSFLNSNNLILRIDPTEHDKYRERTKIGVLGAQKYRQG